MESLTPPPCTYVPTVTWYNNKSPMTAPHKSKFLLPTKVLLDLPFPGPQQILTPLPFVKRIQHFWNLV